MPSSSADRAYPMAFLALMLGAAAWLLYHMMQPFLQPIFVAFVLAVAFAPVHRRIKKKIRKQGLAAFVTTMLVILLVVGPMIGMVTVFAQQGMAAYSNLSRISAAEGGWGEWGRHIIEGPIHWVSTKTGVPTQKLQEAATGWIQALSQRLISGLGSMAANLGGTLSDSIIVFFTLFFFFLEGVRLQEGFLNWLPIERVRAQHLLSVTIETIHANLYGVVAVSSLQGALTGLALLFCGIQSWFFWGVVAAFASLVPLVGAALVWVPVAIFFLLLGSWGKALFLAVWGVLVIGMADNIVRPWIVSGKTSLSTLTVFFALLGGMNAFGLIGLVAGPLVFTLVITLYRIIEEIRLGDPDLALPRETAGPTS